MQTRWIAAAALGLSGAYPAAAASGTIAVLPPYVSTNAAGNAAPVREALRETLERHGLQVLPDDQVAAEMKHLGIESSRPPSVAALSKLRNSLGVDYVLFPRVLAVGRGAASGVVQATILVNVAAASPASFFHTRQFAQKFTAPAVGTPIIPRAAAESAAAELLKGFFDKAK